MTAALLALVLAASDVPPATPEVRVVKVAIVRDPNGVGEVEVTGGCHIPGVDCIARAREKAACRARAERLEKGVTAAPLVATGAVAFTLGLAIGVGVTVLVIERNRQ